MNVLLEVKGHTGQLVITDRKVIIRRAGLGGLLARGPMAGDKEIPLKSITAIEYRDAGLLTNGRIQFSIQGELGHKGGAISAVSDENTVVFTRGQREAFAKAKSLIEELMQRAEQPTVVQQLSSADELKKFADLKQQGLITEQEYELKKKQLLGL